MDLDALKIILKDEPAFRYRQVMKAIFGHLIENWDEATDLSRLMRQRLEKELPLAMTAQVYFSRDKATAKAAIQLADGLTIETVLMRHKDRNTVCVSSQVGCPMGCVFCATGQLGFKRNLTSGEIVMQVLFFSRLLKKENRRLDNVVFMGMGEPFLNYDQVMTALGIINSPDGFNIGARKISISTVGIIGGIKRLSADPRQFNLAISLHAPDNDLRSRIIPYNNKLPIEKILNEVAKYMAKTDRRVMFEYVMIKGLNDSQQQAEALADLLKQIPRHLCVINLIAYNQTGKFQPSAPLQINMFKGVLVKRGYIVTQRYTFGQGIAGACGQLAGGRKN